MRRRRIGPTGAIRRPSSPRRHAGRGRPASSFRTCHNRWPAVSPHTTRIVHPAHRDPQGQIVRTPARPPDRGPRRRTQRRQTSLRQLAEHPGRGPAQIRLELRTQILRARDSHRPTTTRTKRGRPRVGPDVGDDVERRDRLQTEASPPPARLRRTHAVARVAAAVERRVGADPPSTPEPNQPVDRDVELAPGSRTWSSATATPHIERPAASRPTKSVMVDGGMAAGRLGQGEGMSTPGPAQLAAGGTPQRMPDGRGRAILPQQPAQQPAQSSGARRWAATTNRGSQVELAQSATCPVTPSRSRWPTCSSRSRTTDPRPPKRTVPRRRPGPGGVAHSSAWPRRGRSGVSDDSPVQ